MCAYVEKADLFFGYDNSQRYPIAVSEAHRLYSLEFPAKVMEFKMGLKWVVTQIFYKIVKGLYQVGMLLKELLSPS